MKRLVLLSLVLTLGAAQAFADHPTGATTADIRQLQSEADQLDESLAQLNDGSPRAAEFRRREAEIRDELIWLRGQVRRHQRDESQGLGASQADVEELRRSIVALRNDVDRTLDTRPRATGDLTRPQRDRDGGTPRARRSLRRPRGARTASRAPWPSPCAWTAGSRSPPVRECAASSRTRSRPTVRPTVGAWSSRSTSCVMPNGRRVDIRSSVASLQEEGLDKKKRGPGRGARRHPGRCAGRQEGRADRRAGGRWRSRGRLQGR